MIGLTDYLRDYQEGGVANCYRAWSSGKRRVVLVADTGTGKTRPLARMAYDCVVKRHKRAILFTHRTLLAEQTSAEFSRIGIPHGTVMEGTWSDPDAPCQIALVQSLGTDFHWPADLAMVDEAHRSDADPLLARYTKAFILGATATPYKYQNGNKVGLAENYDELVTFPITRQELVARGFLVPMSVVGIELPGLENVAVRAGEYTQAQLAKLMSSPPIVGNIVETWRKHAAGRPTFGFAVNVAHAKILHAKFKEAGIHAPIITGDTDRGVRKQVLAEVADGRTPVVITVDVLGTGVDVPEISCIGLWAPTTSEINYLQRCGRGTRPAPWAGKKDCLVLDHAACSVFLGPPDMQRTPFPLGSVPEKRAPKMPDVPLWRCGECFTTFTGPRPKECPHCNAVNGKVRRIATDPDGKLVEYDADHYALLESMRLEREAAAKVDSAENKKRFKALWNKSFSFGIKSSPRRTQWIWQTLSRWKNSGLDFDEFLKQLRSS